MGYRALFTVVYGGMKSITFVFMTLKSDIHTSFTGYLLTNIYPNPCSPRQTNIYKCCLLPFEASSFFLVISSVDPHAYGWWWDKRGGFGEAMMGGNITNGGWRWGARIKEMTNKNKNKPKPKPKWKRNNSKKAMRWFLLSFSLISYSNINKVYRVLHVLNHKYILPTHSKHSPPLKPIKIFSTDRQSLPQTRIWSRLKSSWSQRAGSSGELT